MLYSGSQVYIAAADKIFADPYVYMEGKLQYRSEVLIFVVCSRWQSKLQFDQSKAEFQLESQLRFTPTCVTVKMTKIFCTYGKK